TRSCAPRTATTTARACCASITRGTIIPTRGACTASAKSSVNRPAPVSLIGLLTCNTFPPKLRPAIFRFNTKHAPRLSPSPPSDSQLAGATEPIDARHFRDAEAIAEADSGRPARFGAVAHGAARYPELRYTRAVATNGQSHR